MRILSPIFTLSSSSRTLATTAPLFSSSLRSNGLPSDSSKLPTSGNGGSMPFSSTNFSFGFAGRPGAPSGGRDRLVSGLDDPGALTTSSIFEISAGEKSFVELTSISAVINARASCRQPCKILDQRTQRNDRTDAERDAQKKKQQPPPG